MQNIPLFGPSATLLSPPSGTVTSGFLPLQLLPAEYLNYYLNADTQAVQELVNVITFAGLVPSSSVQLLTAISGILTNAFAGTYVNQVAIRGSAGNVLDAGAILQSLTFKGALTYTSTTTFSVAPGGVGDDTFVSTIILATSLTKSLSAFSAGAAGGSLDTGAIAASTGYYVYVIKNPSTRAVDILISLSATAPTMPSGFTLKRMIGWVLTNGSSQLVQWLGYVGGEQAWVTLTSDINDTTLTTSRKTYTVANLPNVAHDTKFNVNIFAAGGLVVYFQGDSNLNDTAPSISSPVTGTLDTQGAGFNSNTQINSFYMTGRSMYARSTSGSTTFAVSIVSFNLRPYN